MLAFRKNETFGISVKAGLCLYMEAFELGYLEQRIGQISAFREKYKMLLFIK
jgi:hypothetical protein